MDKTTIITVVAILCFLGIGFYLFGSVKSLHSQKSLIDYYEKQGVVIFPGAKRPYVGNIEEHEVYGKVRSSEEVVGFQYMWLLENIGMFFDKK